MRPPPANYQSGNDIFKIRQAGAEHPAARSAGTTRAGLAVRPLLKSHQSSICATCTQLRTQNTMGTGGGISGAQPTIQYHFITFPFTLKDIALVQLLQNSRIVGLTWERKPRRQQALGTAGNTQVESIYDCCSCFIYFYVACPWIGYVKSSYFVSA